MEPCLLKVKSILHEYNEQFKAVGGGEFKIPFMADNIGGFKINGTVGWATIGLVRRRCPDSSFRNSFNRDFNPAVGRWAL
jgi:hypothetical protein